MSRYSILIPLLAALFMAGCTRKSAVERRQSILDSAAREAAAGRYAAEQLLLRRALKEFPNDAEAQYRLARSYRLTGQPWYSASLLRRTLESAPQHRGAQRELARLMAVNSDRKVLLEARSKIEALLESDPRDGEALSILSLIEWRLGERKEAESDMDRARQALPENLRMTLALAEMKLARKDPAGAEAALREAASHAKLAQSAHMALAELYASTGRPADAERSYRAALERKRDAFPLLGLANFLVREGRAKEAEPLYRELAVLPDPSFRVLHAEFLIRTSRAAEGLRELQDLHSKEPGNRAVRRQLLIAYRLAGKPEEAKQAAFEMLKRNPRDAEALLDRSAIRLASGEITEAKQDLDAVLEGEPNNALAHFLTAKVHQRTGQTASRRESLSATLKADPYFLPARLELAHLLLRSAPKTALELLDKAPEKQRIDLALITERNWVLLACADAKALEAGIRQGLARAPLADFLLQKAALQMHQRDYAGARRTAAQLLERDPEDTKALEVVVRSYLTEQQAAEALQALERHAAAHPRSARLRAYQGQTLLALGRTDEARKAYEAALGLAPEDAPSQLALASLDAAGGRLQQARSRVEKMRQTSPNYPPVWLVAGDLALRSGEQASALESYRHALDLDPDNVQALNNVADLLTEHAGRPDEALQYALRAKELSPDLPVVQHTLGWILCKRGMWQAGVPHLESAVSSSRNRRRSTIWRWPTQRRGRRRRGEGCMTKRGGASRRYRKSCGSEDEAGPGKDRRRNPRLR